MSQLAVVLGATTASSKSTPIFLVPNGTIVVELIIFLIVFGIVAKFILPPIQAVMNERSRTVAEALRGGEEARHEAAELDAKRAAVLEQARATARVALEEAAQTVSEMVEAARAEGRAEHDRLLAQATTAIEAERTNLRDEAAERLGPLVVESASRVIGAPVDGSRHASVIADAKEALSEVKR